VALVRIASYINKMARDTFRKKTPEEKLSEATQGMAAYRAQQAAVDANMARLRALRLAREAEPPPPEDAKPAIAKPRRKVTGR
jgi:hypothetical protein